MKLYINADKIEHEKSNGVGYVSDEFADWMDSKLGNNWDGVYNRKSNQFILDLPDDFRHLVELKLRFG